MKNANSNSYYSYNNEIIGIVAMISIFKLSEKISISKAMLILPLILHDPTMNYLQKGNVKIKSIDQLVVDKYQFLTNFNNRFSSMLPISLNCLYLLEKMNHIKIEDGYISKLREIDLNVKKLGKRGMKIYKSSYNMRNILDASESYLYLQLRVEL
ncbi:three component ABC system middle component [Metabacillus sp. HB246100]